MIVRFLLLLFVTASCLAADHGGKDEKDHSEEFAEANENSLILSVDSNPKDFKLPSSLWDLLTSDVPGSGDKKSGHESNSHDSGGHGGTEGSAEQKKQELIIVWTPIKVKFKSEHSGVLRADDLEIEYPRGGGEVNFSKIVLGEKGSIFIKFDLSGFNDPKAVRAYFLSRSKKRKVDGDIYGSGCNVFFELGPDFFNQNGSSGLKVNVTLKRHISTLGGHFIFTYKDKEKLYVSQIQFLDSQSSELLCQKNE